MNGTSGFLLMGGRLKRNDLGTPNSYEMHGNQDVLLIEW